MRFRMFQPRFADLVEAGLKMQTVRPTPKRLPQVGDLESWRKWAGRPYRSPHVVLRTVRIINVHECLIDPFALTLDREEIWCRGRDVFARADGFNDWQELLTWFAKNHGTISRSKPFRGIAIFAEGVKG